MSGDIVTRYREMSSRLAAITAEKAKLNEQAFALGDEANRIISGLRHLWAAMEILEIDLDGLAPPPEDRTTPEAILRARRK